MIIVIMYIIEQEMFKTLKAIIPVHNTLSISTLLSISKGNFILNCDMFIYIRGVRGWIDQLSTNTCTSTYRANAAVFTSF